METTRVALVLWGKSKKRLTEQNKLDLYRLICGTRRNVGHLKCGVGDGMDGDSVRTSDGGRQSQVSEETSIEHSLLRGRLGPPTSSFEMRRIS